jgi:biotin carboxyl carrier protein
MRTYNVKVNGKLFLVEVESVDEVSEAAPSPAKVSAPQEIQSVAAPVASKPQPANESRSEASVSVLSPLPGLVLSLAVENGASVKKNDKILVIEAMKMEHDIVAGADGKIAFLVKKGDNVETGTELAYIK